MVDFDELEVGDAFHSLNYENWAIVTAKNCSEITYRWCEVPLPAIYTLTKDDFVRLQGYMIKFTDLEKALI